MLYSLGKINIYEVKLDLFKAILKIQGVCKKLSSIVLPLYVILGTWSPKNIY